MTTTEILHILKQDIHSAVCPVKAGQKVEETA